MRKRKVKDPVSPSAQATGYLLCKWFECEGAISAEETGFGFVLDGIVVGCFAVLLGVATQDGDEVGRGFDTFEKGCGAGQVARFGPPLAAFDFVFAVGVKTPDGVAA